MRTPPHDRWHAAYGILFLQGIGQLFPWNVFINAEDYFRRRFCGSSFESSFENCFAFGYNFSCILGVVLALRHQERFSIRGRIMGSLALSVLTFVACALLVVMEKVSANFLFVATMVCILLSGLAVAVFQGALFAFVSAFPPKYTQAIMAGQGLAGLAVALAGLFTTLAGPDDTSCGDLLDLDVVSQDGLATSTNYVAHRGMASGERMHLNMAEATATASGDLDLRTLAACEDYSFDVSTFIYFCIAVVVLGGCMLSYPILSRLPLTVFYTQLGTIGGNKSGNFSAEVGDGGGTNGVGCDSCGDGNGNNSSNWHVCSNKRSGGFNDSTSSFSMHRRLVEESPSPLLLPVKPLSDGDTVLLEADEGGRVIVVTDGGRFNGVRAQLAPIARYAFAVFFVFVVTLSTFPGATSEIVSSRECSPGRARFFATDVFILFSFLSFNVFDFSGRLLAGTRFVIPPSWLPGAAVMRLVFVPLFLACRSSSSRLPQWLSADRYPLIIMPLFAFTNGYIGSLCMMSGSQHGTWAGTAMVLFLSAGLFVGSSLSFLVLYATNG